MKKNILIILAFIAALGLRAQDTMYYGPLPSNYYYNQWLGDGDTKDIRYSCWGFDYSFIVNYFGKYFFTPDTMPVYGIAVAMGYNSYLRIYGDSIANMYEFVSIYKHEGDSLRKVGDSLRVHMYETPVSYYINDEPEQPPIFDLAPDAFPVFEVYYDTPVVVTDSFFLCMTCRSSEKYWGWDENNYWNWLGFTNYPVHGIALQKYRGDIIVEGRQVYSVQQPSMDNPNVMATFYYYWDVNTDPPNFWDPFIFPILTPYSAPDTTGSDTTHVDPVDTTHVDTVGISAQMLERYTGVHPNPATERVLVTSSFGLQEIVLYNAAGAQVKEQKASGYSTTLDVSALPAGAYILKVRTPSGTATKKLIVQRR